MSVAQGHAEPLADAQAAVLLRQVILSQATRLARAGSYAAAEELLSGLLATERPDATVLDLLARIRVQQGAILDAESLWRKVEQLDPNHLGARAGLERIRSVQRRPVWFQSALNLLIGFGVILCGVLALSLQANRQSNANAQIHQQMQAVLSSVKMLNGNQALTEERLVKLDGWATAQRVVSGQLVELHAEAKRLASRQEALAQSRSNQVDALHRGVEKELASVKHHSAQLESMAQAASNQVAALRLTLDREYALVAENKQHRVAVEKLKSAYESLAASHKQLLTQAGPATDPLTLVIKVPGVNSSVSGKLMVLTFGDGLFDHGTHFKLGAKERLSATLKALAQNREHLAIEVVGYSDGDQGVFGPLNSFSLGLKRAAVVVDFIRSSALFSPNQLRASSGGSAQLPFPNDSAKVRAQNRTVVLLISRDGK